MWWYFCLVLLPSALVVIAGLLVSSTRYLGACLMCISGIAIIVGYASPLSAFGVYFVYGGIKGIGNHEISS